MKIIINTDDTETGSENLFKNILVILEVPSYNIPMATVWQQPFSRSK